MEKKNVLLLSMSILRGTNIPLSHYCYKDEKIEGYSQLEPVPKLLIKQGKLDKILVLATPETQKIDENKTICLEGKGVNPDEQSACDVFEQEIKKYAEAEKKQIDITRIDLDENALYKGINDAVHQLRKYSKMYEMSLYLDIHGGPRDQQLIIEAILSLLKIENIKPEMVYTVETDGKATKEKPGIIKQKNPFDAFTFVSGITEFINYGRAETLSKYLDDVGEAGQKKGLVDLIKNLADDIQICDIGGFESHLSELYSKYGQEGDKPKEMDGYLGIFLQNIWDDYGIKLLNKRTSVELLKWCKRKGFYQQALTIIESKMPAYICEHYFNTNIEEKKDEIDQAKEEMGKYWENYVNYGFEQCMRAMFPKRKMMDINKVEEEKRKTRAYWKFGEGIFKGKISKKNSTEISMTPCDGFLNKNKANDLNILLQIHRVLKEQRNNVNHASDDESRPSTENLFKTIDWYIELAEELDQYKK